MIFLRTSLVSPFSYAFCLCSSTMFITILFLFPKIRHQYDFLLRLCCSAHVSPHVRRLDVKTGSTFNRAHYASNHHIHTVCFCEFAFNAGRAPFIKPLLSDGLIRTPFIFRSSGRNGSSRTSPSIGRPVGGIDKKSKRSATWTTRPASHASIGSCSAPTRVFCCPSSWSFTSYSYFPPTFFTTPPKGRIRTWTIRESFECVFIDNVNLTSLLNKVHQ